MFEGQGNKIIGLLIAIIITMSFMEAGLQTAKALSSARKYFLNFG